MLNDQKNRSLLSLSVMTRSFLLRLDFEILLSLFDCTSELSLEWSELNCHENFLLLLLRTLLCAYKDRDLQFSTHSVNLAIVILSRQSNGRRYQFTMKSCVNDMPLFYSLLFSLFILSSVIID